jgi:hypothetical protein
MSVRGPSRADTCAVWQRSSPEGAAAADVVDGVDGDGDGDGDGEDVGAGEADADPAVGGTDGAGPPHPANPRATSTDSPMSARMHPPDESPRTVLDQGWRGGSVEGDTRATRRPPVMRR